MLEITDYCEFCDGLTKPGLVTHTFKREGRKFTFENIKAQICQKCGETYLDGKAVDDIENRIEKEVYAAA